MTPLSYTLDDQTPKTLGLIVLQSDETIEQDIRLLLPSEVQLHTSRVPSGLEVTSDSLQSMEAHLPSSANLLPRGLGFDVIGYGCTSGTAQIGAGKVAELIRQGATTHTVTEPVTALIAACQALGVNRLAFLSPYVGEVSARLRSVLQDAGIETPIFGSFEEAEEAKVARIAPASVFEAGQSLCAGADVDAVFLSCTNLRTLQIIPALEAATGLPVLSSNQVLIWHMARLSGLALARDELGRLLQHS